MSGAAPSRKKARAYGARAEWLAVLWLRLKFYAVLDRNFSAAGGEIDIIARRGGTIVFVEVKARDTLEQAFAALTAEKARRMSKAARRWIAAHPDAARCAFRGDGVFLAPWRWPRHIEGAATLDVFL